MKPNYFHFLHYLIHRMQKPQFELLGIPLKFLGLGGAPGPILGDRAGDPPDMKGVFGVLGDIEASD